MRKLPVTMLAIFAILSILSRSGLAEFGKRQELTVRGIQRALEQRDLADHFATLRRKILDHARTRLEGRPMALPTSILFPTWPLTRTLAPISDSTTSVKTR